MKYRNQKMINRLLLFFIIGIAIVLPVTAQVTPASSEKKKTIILYGQASYYAGKFQGRKTASGEAFNHVKYTAACNSLPLGTWVKVTNLKNGKTITVKINDRLHAKTSRLIDLTKAAAEKLGFIKAGLTRVKVEVLGEKEGK